MKKKLLIICCFALLISFSTFAAPYNGAIVDFPQPDGSSVQVKLFGDEYYMRGESLDGYTLVRDADEWLCYAQLSTEGTLESTGIHYNHRDSKTNLRSKNGVLEKHIDISTTQRQGVIAQKKAELETGNEEVQRRSFTRAKTKDYTVKGTYKALVILVDFPDQPAEVSKEIIGEMFNSTNFTYNGNNGSVKQYYSDVSGGLVNYEGVVFGYYRAPKTFEEYNKMEYGSGAKELLNLSLKWIDSQGFDFSTLHITNGNITAINLMYTGSPKDWAQGMWYHASSYTGFSADGVRSGSYNTSPAKTNLSIGTTVHENGHMLCKWPDLYSYDSDKTGNDGIGTFCVMAGAGNDKNPVVPNPYLRMAAGWLKPTEVYSFNDVVTESFDDFKVYKYTNPKNASEFFLTDVRYKSGRDASLPDNGLTIWHIDRQKDQQVEQNDNGGAGTSHREVYLEHANNDFTRHNAACFNAAGNKNFNDNTIPNAKWYDNSNSGLKISEISAEGKTMSYRIGTINIEMKEPYTGNPIEIPGVLEAENYDKGGEGVSYHDTDPSNNGTGYRNDGVDISSNASIINIGWTAVGEWLEYTVNINETTSYKAEFITSSLNGGGSLGLELDGKSVLSDVSVPSSSDWDTYTTFVKDVDLTKGKHLLRINIKTAGFNIDKITFTKKPTCSLTSYININNTDWKVESIINTAIGNTISFEPHSSTTQNQNTTGWTWTGPDNFISNTKNNLLTDIQAVNAGTYKVSYTDPNGCKATLDIIINPPCDIIPYVKINNKEWNTISEVEVNVGDVVWFGPQSNIDGVSTTGWSWTGPNNLSNETRSLSISDITSNNDGKYTASYTTSTGCKSSHDFMVTTSTVTALGSSIGNQSLSIYPNPSTNGQFQLTQSANWEVYSSLGLLIKKGESETIDLSGETAGFYFLKTKNGVNKIVIQ